LPEPDAGTTMLEWLGSAFKAYRWYKNRSTALPINSKAEDDAESSLERTPTHPKLFETDFYGSETKVKLVRSDIGIAMIDAETGVLITAQRSLKQSDLESVRIGVNTGVFVNLTLQDGEIVSCFISEPENEIFGSMRAFWWSLARRNVWTARFNTISMNNNTPGFAAVYGQAREMWDEAIKQAGSIYNMRDMIMPMRNIHFEVISKMKENAEHPAHKLGLEIALALVLATQADDPKLEAYAFRCFSRFIWLPGEEPAEFRGHAA